MVGKTLGHYEILEPLGKGGMGEVYRARDTKLDRDVAIKVLPEDFAQDADRLARFEREAKLLAALNHANIAAIYGLEDEGDQRFIVMEVVEGETLAHRIACSGRIEVDEALEIARQIAEALEAAHEAGIVHRDLKPANVIVTPEGKAKVLDFGLAKAYETDGSATGGSPDMSDSPTIVGETRTGVIMGTVSYMSPEQARGKRVDRRADIWAFGCLLWEMLTGRRLFGGESVSDSLAAVLRDEIDLDALPVATPTAIRRLMRRSLERDPKRRLHSAADARLEIEEAMAAPDQLEFGGVAAPSARAGWWMLPAGIALGLIAAALAGQLLGAPEPLGVVRLDVSMPPGVSLEVTSPTLRPAVALSPDGRWLAFIAIEDGTRHVFKRSLDSFELTRVAGTENARFAFFSPDSRWLGFWDGSEETLEKVPVDGGTPTVICEVPNAWGATWGPDGKIVFAPGGDDYLGLSEVSEAGGEPTRLLPPRHEIGEASHVLPEFLPDGGGVLYTTWRGGFTLATSQIGLLDLASGDTEVLLDNASSARYLPSGHLAFGRGGRVEVVPFDLARRKITGPAVVIPEPAFYDADNGLMHLAAANGTLAFVPFSGTPQRSLVYVDLDGNQEPVVGELRGYEYPRVSPDGRRLATTISESGESNLWIVDLSTGVQTRLAGEGQKAFPQWSPDGQTVVFSVPTDEPPASWSIFEQRVGAIASPEPLVMAREPGEKLWPSSWTSDGKYLVIGTWGASRDIVYMDTDGGGELVPFVASAADERYPLVSPVGHWLAYASNETGRWAIYVQSFPEGGERHQISAQDTDELFGWAPDGRTIYYVADGTMMEVPITTSPNFQAGAPRELFKLRYGRGIWFNRDALMSPDGEHFVIATPDEGWGVATEIKVVLNWFEELKRLAPTDGSQ